MDLTNPKMCRACLSINTEVQSLYFIETHYSTSLLDMFMTSTSLDISENDGYPKQICKNCIQDLLRAFDFRTKCHNSLKQLYILANNTDFKKVINIEVDVSIVKSESDNSCDTIEKFHDVPALSNTFEQLSPKGQKIQDSLANNQQDVPLTISTDIMQNEVKSKMRKPKKARLKSYTCTICNEKFSRRLHLREHKKMHKVVKKCRECWMEFLSIEAYKEHASIHTYLCPDCGRIFNRRAGLKAHRISHTDEHPYECKDCEKKYKTAEALLVHKRNHTGEKLYRCDECGKKFITWNSKSSHIITHHREAEAHICKICNQSFKKKSYLTIHIRQHTGEKPYQCSECLKCFASNAVRKSHMKIHTGEKNIVCTLCDKRFIKKYGLTQHMRTHMREGKEEVCGKQFTEVCDRPYAYTNCEIYAQKN